MNRWIQGQSALTAADIMSTPTVTCRPETFFEEVAELLADREISGMPVVNGDGEVVGVISERDLAHALGGPLMRLVLRRPVRSGPFLREPPSRSGSRVQDIMTAPALLAQPRDTSAHPRRDHGQRAAQPHPDRACQPTYRCGHATRRPCGSCRPCSRECQARATAGGSRLRFARRQLRLSELIRNHDRRNDEKDKG